MLTGARVGEVRQARFEHFNLEHLSWSKPASMTKQRKIHRLPISDEAAAIVRQRLLLVPRGCTLLFPGDALGQPVKEIRCFWRSIQTVSYTHLDVYKRQVHRHSRRTAKTVFLVCIASATVPTCALLLPQCFHGVCACLLYTSVLDNS